MSFGLGSAVRALVGRSLALPVRLVHRLRFGSAVVLELRLDASEHAVETALLVRALRRAAADPRVVGLLLWIEAPPGGWASGEDLRDALHAFRAANKRVIAWAPSLDNQLSWIGAAADELYVPPLGDVSLVGLGADVVFFGGLLDKLGIEADFVAAGAYKSFGETWQRSYASPANHEATNALLADLQATVLADIGADRGLTPAALEALLARAPLSPSEAAEAGLIHGVAYADELYEKADALGDVVDFAAWDRSRRVLDWLGASGQADRVVVLHLEGAVVYEATGAGASIDAIETCALLEELADDESVKAVVLSVNSPGGSALASDLIWRSVEQLRAEIPVIAAFGDVSASGGFYLAAGAPIVARRTTITGSIGVFGGKAVLGGAARKLGIVSQAVVGGPHALWDRPFRRFSDSERARFRAMLERTYVAFVERVAAGRGVTVAQIEPLCQGRVWAGSTAAASALVEHTGGIERAVELAMERAALTRAWRVDRVVQADPPWRTLLRAMVGRVVPGLQGNAVVKALGAQGLGEVAAVVMSLLEEPAALVMLPFRAKIR